MSFRSPRPRMYRNPIPTPSPKPKGTIVATHQATCKCGWVGPIRTGKDADGIAENDYIAHQMAEDRA